MRNFLIVIFTLITCLYAIPASYAAVVNGTPIPLSEFNTAVEGARKNLAEQHNIDLESEEGKFILATTQRSILDDMIDQIIIRQQAEKMNITVTAKDITNEIDRLRSGFPSQQAFEETLVQENINAEDLTEGVRSRLVSEKIKKSLAAKIEISVQELESFLRSNQDFLAPEDEETPGSEDTDIHAEARKYLLQKKENEVFERWFAKTKSSAKIEINSVILKEDIETPPSKSFPRQDNTITNGRV